MVGSALCISRCDKLGRTPAYFIHFTQPLVVAIWVILGILLTEMSLLGGLVSKFACDNRVFFIGTYNIMECL